MSATTCFMTPERYQKIRELFLKAREMGAEPRESFLEDACKDDPELRMEVEKLLADEERATTFLEGPDFAETSRSLGEAHICSPGAPLPDRIGRYRIVRKIGSGGMGTVYEAEQDTPRRIVASKMVNVGVANESMLRRFEYEAQVLGRLQHPDIAQIFEADTFDSGHGAQPFFAMELVQGIPLTEYAERHNLGTRQRLELIARICDAVQHAHQRGVIHRDLKPANILVTEGGQPKILDFGVARATDSGLQATTYRTGIGQIIGTVPYMSPEQAAGDQDEIDSACPDYLRGRYTASCV